MTWPPLAKPGLNSTHPAWCERQQRECTTVHMGPTTTLRRKTDRINLYTFQPVADGRARAELVLINEAVDLADERREASIALTPKMIVRLRQILLQQLVLMGLDPGGPPAEALGVDPKVIEMARRISARLQG